MTMAAVIVNPAIIARLDGKVAVVTGNYTHSNTRRRTQCIANFESMQEAQMALDPRLLANCCVQELGLLLRT